jgi:DNA invertase Pin-like site-specific DNA recombinase
MYNNVFAFVPVFLNQDDFDSQLVYIKNYALAHSFDVNSFILSNFNDLFSVIKQGDLVLFFKLNFICVSLKDAFSFFSLLDSKGVHFISVTEESINSVVSGNLILEFLKVFSCLEDDSFSLHAQLALKVADKFSSKLGRREGMHAHSVKICQDIYLMYSSNLKLSINYLCSEHKISKRTFYKFCKENNLKLRSNE